MVVLTDLVDPAAAAALLEAVPVLVRRHAVVVASCTDVELLVAAEGTAPGGNPAESALRSTVATRMLSARDRAAAEIAQRGARVVEAPPERLSSAVVAAYLNAKSAARL